MKTVRCKYRCNACGIESDVIVPARESPEVDITKWVERVGRLVKLDHGTKRPNCLERHVDLMLPAPDVEGSWIGKYHEQEAELPKMTELFKDKYDTNT